MIRFDDEQKKEELTGVEFGYYDSVYLMDESGKIYKRFKSGFDREASYTIQHGILKLVMSSGSRRKLVSVARLVKHLLEDDERDRKWTIKHLDGDKMNCHPSNIEWVKFNGRNGSGE